MGNLKFRVQLITAEGQWPYVGNAYLNRNGSISVYFDRDLTLAANQRLYLQQPRPKTEAETDSPPEVQTES